MSWRNLNRAFLALAGSLILCGCGPAATGAADEEKEPQFLIGRSRVNAMDWQGAIEAFEQALEANPRSAAAHFELGILYAEKEQVPATAIYHYEKFLNLRPQAGNAETIRQHIFRLKQELAKGVMPIPPSTEIQRQLERLAMENRQLREQLDRLQAAPPQPVVDARPVQSTPAAPVVTTAPAGAGRSAGGYSTPKPERLTSSTRTHRVKAGETPMAIARRYDLRLDALLGANPGLNPKRLQIGQSLVIPNR